MPPKPRNLLLCFDAFGTLIRPNQPVIKQYALVAEQFGLGVRDNSDSASDDGLKRLEKSFKEAFKTQNRMYPNFGKMINSDQNVEFENTREREVVMTPEKWWDDVITNTFTPFLPNGQQNLPSGLANKLLHRFSSSEGYDLTVPDLQSHLRRIKSLNSNSGGNGGGGGYKTTIGVITNSDDRIPSVLSSCGLNVSPIRYGTLSSSPDTTKTYDIDFHVMSYDSGYAKPDPRIFEQAAELAHNMGQKGSDIEIKKEEEEEWTKIYVGDEFENDLLGANKAGWHGILVLSSEASEVDGVGKKVPDGLGLLELEKGKRFEQVFPPNGKAGYEKFDDYKKGLRMIKGGSLGSVLEWFGKMLHQG
ncbi:hypothetical protein QBC43DRAFT_112624 [Cladorrhinum sp. PSN259]|nr:hypothetical protein QBC43DRAFT_112624 [Cladorrhinum sp. PSN259]